MSLLLRRRVVGQTTGIVEAAAWAVAELTDTIPQSTTAKQWGAPSFEEAVIPQAILPATVDVHAYLTGRVRPQVTTAGQRALCKVEISLDDGTTWQDGWTGTNDPMVTQAALGVDGRDPISDQCQALGATVSGNVRARALCWDSDTAGDFQFEGGRLLLTCRRIT